MNIIDELINLSDYNREPEGFESIVCASEYIETMREEIGTPAAVVKGYALPWSKTESTFRYHPGEVIVWAGANGSGKSLITGMVALDAMCRRERVCIASLEMSPRKTLTRMLRNWVGMDPRSFHGQADSEGILRDLYTDMASMARDHLWVYDQVGSVASEKMIGLVRYAAKKLGIKHFVIDSLMKCVAGTDNYNAQKDFVNELCAIGKDYQVTIHLVAHTKKMPDEAKRPSKYDVSGAGDITNLADSVMLFWRNKPKEAARRKGDSSTDGEPDALLICCKQRELGDEPEFALWYDHDSESYVEGPGAKPINWFDRCT